MAILRFKPGGIWCGLHADHLIGRSSRCDLQIDEGYLSAQHASVRWTGTSWEVKDLGSRNGTLIDGARIEAGRFYPLAQGMSIAFGSAGQTWHCEDASEPRIMAFPLEGGAAVALDGELLAIPSADEPEVVIFRGADGSWQLERPDEVLTRIDHDETFVADGKRWLFCNPRAMQLTAALEGRVSLRNVCLHLSVSSDEEHVDLRVDWPASRKTLGSRTHNYILLTLARHRQSDANSGVPASACGWVYQDDLIRALGTSATQLNVDIFRIRKQFSTLDLSDTAAIIERRPRTKQIRIGVGQLVIERI